jgi:hypothetical protein
VQLAWRGLISQQYQQGGEITDRLSISQQNFRPSYEQRCLLILRPRTSFVLISDASLRKFSLAKFASHRLKNTL